MTERVIAGRCAMVTGGARGIGRATAEALLREGVRVAIADLDGDLCQKTAEALSGIGPEIRAYPLDVRDREGFSSLVGRAERELAPLDILVNNAGIMSLGGFLDQDPLLDERQLDINLRGVIHGTRAALPGMLRRGRGHVVNIASVAGKLGIPFAAVYSASKHAVVGLTEALHNEHRDSGISFSYVLPGIVQTELSSGAGRLRYPPPILPEDVAAAVVHALRTGRVDVYVPRFTRISAVLPALLPRRLTERLGSLFGVDRVFASIDEKAREVYRQRLNR